MLAALALAVLGCGTPDVDCDADHDGHASIECGGDDCCDFDADARPGAEPWHTDQNACGSYDYDCNSGTDQRFGLFGSCDFECSGIPNEVTPLATEQWGYLDIAPACGFGSHAGVATACMTVVAGGLPTCEPVVEPVLQECR